MARSHISYDEPELQTLEIALREFIARSHDAARLLDAQITAQVQSEKMRETVDIYRAQANRATEMVKRMKQGYRGLQEVK